MPQAGVQSQHELLERLRAGDEQAFASLADRTHDGSLAEFVAVEARNLAPLPAEAPAAFAPDRRSPGKTVITCPSAWPPGA